jgi:hypothetical protein
MNGKRVIFGVRNVLACAVALVSQPREEAMPRGCGPAVPILMSYPSRYSSTAWLRMAGNQAVPIFDCNRIVPVRCNGRKYLLASPLSTPVVLSHHGSLQLSDLVVIPATPVTSQSHSSSSPSYISKSFYSTLTSSAPVLF